MHSRGPATALLSFVLAAGAAVPAFAWGPDGHRIIAGIAERHLNPQARANVAVLLQRESLRDVAPWADDIREEMRDNPALRARYGGTLIGHFVPIPRKADSFDAQRDCRGGCTVAQIASFARILRDPSMPLQDRVDALRFVVHFVGDIHQPLHCSDDGDLGSNRVRMIFFGKMTNVHTVWDIHLLTHGGTKIATYIDQLDARLRLRDFDSVSSGTPGEWATQAHRIARDAAYVIPTGPDASQRYYDANLPLLEDQLMKGGARLARLLNQVIGGEPIPKRQEPPPPPPSDPSWLERLRMLYDAHHGNPWFWIVTGAVTALGTYILGLAAILMLASTRGSQFIARSRLRKLAVAPLRIQPATARWVLMIGYRARIRKRPDVVRAATSYFGLPAVLDDGQTILPDMTGNRLHDAIAASAGAQKPLFVLGAGGAGKSTLLARLAHLGVTGKLPGALHGYVPVLVAAADYTDDFVLAIGAALRDRDGVDAGVKRDAIIGLLQSGKFLILFDGLSEIFGKPEDALREIMHTSTSAALRSCRVIIATRQLSGDAGGSRLLELQPLTPTVIETLLDHYALPEAARNRVRKQIASFAGGSIAPLLFTMMLEATGEDELATKQSHLYERYFKTQLKTKTAQLKTQLETDDEWLGWREALETLAMRFVLPAGRRGYGMSRAQLIDFLSGKREGLSDEESTLARLKRIYRLDAGDALEMMRRLINARILTGDRRIRFAHDTFEEYFLASAIVTQFAEHGTWSPPEWLHDDARAQELRKVEEFIDEIDQEGRERFQAAIQAGRETSAGNAGERPDSPVKATRKLRVFISYAHEDSMFLDQLRGALTPDERAGELEVWADPLIEPGQKWEEGIFTNLDRADIVILLLSNDFMRSSFCVEKELARALERRAIIVPVVVRATRFEKLPIGAIQAILPDGKPVSEHEHRDRAWLEVTKQLDRVIHRMTS